MTSPKTFWAGILVAAAFSQVGCGNAFVAGMAGGIAQGTTSVPVTTGAPVANLKLMLFGGEGHKTYLGCLNCSEYASDSVLNKYGSHSSQYSADSIFNQYGTFGSKYSNASPCNPYSSDPPVIVDQNGSFHGRLTVNAYAVGRATGSWAAWIAAVCERG